MKNISLEQQAEKQLEILSRGVVDLVSRDDLFKKIQNSLEKNKPLKIKLGADPTRPDLHLGHAVLLRKMRQFQDLGHKVIMLIGDFTAMIGDPSGRSKTRPLLTKEEVLENAKTYMHQCGLILRTEPEFLEIRYNSEWLSDMKYSQIIELTSKYTVARILERDDFSKRLQNGVPISMHELLYPLTQGYDSVVLESDIELGGTDQLFNNLVGRSLQKNYNQESQIVMTLPLLIGLDGKEKMSKSLDNYISINDPVHKIFAGIMKVPDILLKDYFILLTDLQEKEINEIIQDPVEAHTKLAYEILSWLKPNEDISAAQERFKEIAKGGIPQDVLEIQLTDLELSVVKLVVLAGFEPSNGAAKKLITNRGLRVNGEFFTDFKGKITEEDLKNGLILQKGKDKFIKFKY